MGTTSNFIHWKPFWCSTTLQIQWSEVVFPFSNFWFSKKKKEKKKRKSLSWIQLQFYFSA